MKVLITHTLLRQTKTIEIEDDSTVADLKAKYAEVGGIPAASQRLVHGSKGTLIDTYTLKEAGVSDSTSLNVIREQTEEEKREARERKEQREAAARERREQEAQKKQGGCVVS